MNARTDSLHTALPDATSASTSAAAVVPPSATGPTPAAGTVPPSAAGPMPPSAAGAAARHHAAVTAACRRIESDATMPALAELAAQAGLSPHHFHRVFRTLTGVTPAGYARAVRAERVRRGLGDGSRTITDAVFEAGFQAGSRFYAQSGALLGMRPKDWRAGGARVRVRFAIGQCSLGAILVAESDRGVCAVLLGDEPEALLDDLQQRFPRAELIGADPSFEARVAQVVGWVERPGAGAADALPLDVQGTAFQQRVWQALRDIPAGTTVDYTELAARIGQPSAVRAVARACAANPVAVVIPCHRVVRRDGDLAGYRWGIERKRALLAREARHPVPQGSAPSAPVSQGSAPSAPVSQGSASQASASPAR